jgi:dolichyl-diphosphooligosaccharide--protein glycosyltransferase
MNSTSSSTSSLAEQSPSLESSSPAVKQRLIQLGLFIVAVLVCYGISVQVRHQQLETWRSNPQQFFVGDMPLMTTLDAPFYMRWAREFRDGEYYGTGHKRAYPSSTDWFRQKQENLRAQEEGREPQQLEEQRPRTSPGDVPLLSFMAAMLSPFFAGNIYLVGHWMVIVCAGLFAVPLGIYFYRIGYPAAGLLGGLVGTFCTEYYVRSSVGRIDTDMLNIFFPMLGALFVLLACQSKAERHVWLYSALAGVSMYFFWWWYERPGFTIGCFVTLILGLAVHKKSARVVFPAVLLFAVFAHPANLLAGLASIESFLGNYFFVGAVRVANAQEVVNPVTFPNVFSTISEAGKVKMSEVLQQVLRQSEWGWAGLVAFVAFALRYWKVCLPLLPVFALGLLGFQSSRRFIMYLAPFVGVGLGVLMSVAVQLAWQWIRSRFEPVEAEAIEANPLWKHAQPAGHLFAYAGLAGFFAYLAPQTAMSYVPGPSIPPPIYQTFNEVQKRVPPQGAIFTWWDFGYAITDATRLATFNDGGAQLGPKTYFMARAFISSEPEEMTRIIGFLSEEGSAGIGRFNTSKDALLREVYSGKYQPRDPIYVFYTYDMIGKFSALFSIGSWNFDTLKNSVKGYQRLQCSKLENNILTCNGAKIDLQKGLVNGQIPLKRLVQSMQGRQAAIKDFPHEQGLTLQMLMPNPNQFSDIYLMEEVVYASNFNQMYLLGKYDEEKYEEVFNAFPAARLFQLKQQNAQTE